MELTNRDVAIYAGAALVLAFAAGRWTGPVTVKTEIKTVEVEKKTDDKQTNTDDHKKATIVETTKPDGTKTKTTTITDDRDSKTDDESTDNLNKTTDQTKEITKSKSPLSISLLAAANITAPGTPIYGLAIQRPILGPITLGIFGLSDKTAGVSIGLTF